MIRFQAKFILSVFLPAILFFSVNAGAQTSSEVTSEEVQESRASNWQNSSLSLSARIILRQIEDEFTKSDLVRIDFGIRGRTEFTPWLSGRIEVRFFSMAGSTISVVDQFKPGTGSGFQETYLALEPNQSLSVKLGFVTVSESEVVDIMQANEHPGLKVDVIIGPRESLHARAAAFSVIPTSTLVTPRYFPTDGNPTLQGFSLGAGFLPERGLGFKINGTRMNFASLTPSIAQDSRLLGNNIIGLGGASARFVYEFETDEFNLVSRYKVGRTEISLEGTQAVNRKVSSQLGTGTHAGGSWKQRFNDFSMSLSYSEFYVNPEVYPGSIAADLFSYNNRQGRKLGLAVENPKETMGIRMAYHTYNEIIDQPFLADREFIGFQFFSKNDILSRGKL